jgi:hypothetical protein
MIRVWPKAGAMVRDPQTMQPIEAGAEVDETSRFIQRRLADGDLVKQDPKKGADKEHAVVSESQPDARGTDREQV